MADPSAGEIGGLFAGAVGLIVALGHGLKWWLGWTDRRTATRSAKLDAWQRELDGREHRLDAEQRAYWKTVQAELGQVRREHAALLGAYQLLTAALTRQDPGNQALRQADELLRSAFPIEPATPDDMTRTILAAKRTTEQGEQR